MVKHHQHFIGVAYADIVLVKRQLGLHYIVAHAHAESGEVPEQVCIPVCGPQGLADVRAPYQALAHGVVLGEEIADLVGILHAEIQQVVFVRVHAAAGHRGAFLELGRNTVDAWNASAVYHAEQTLAG